MSRTQRSPQQRRPIGAAPGPPQQPSIDDIRDSIEMNRIEARRKEADRDQAVLELERINRGIAELEKMLEAARLEESGLVVPPVGII